ncbi:MAG: FkbM family methyltransferase [Bacteroidia bacterium]|nr:FkbM family methyltransferase [Bacteroidia bacterium]
MSVAPSLCKSLIHHIQQMGILSFDGEQSLGIRLLRVFDLLKNSKKAQKVVPLLPTMWRLLLGKNHHTLYLTHPVKMHILPSNLISLIYLWGNLPCERIEPEQNVIVWQLAPGCLLKSLTNEGTELTVQVELLIRKEYGTNYQGLKVLDIGGYFGESAIFFVSARAESVVCVEPYPPALRRISENLKLSSIKDRVKVIAAAVGPERGEGLLLVSKADPMGNALQGLEGPKVVTNSSSAVKVPTLTFEDVLNEANWEVVDVTKLRL